MEWKHCADTAALSNGVKMPCIGYGTWQAPDSGITVNNVMTALRSGYRHVDTAAIYGNEESVGEGVRKSGIAREDVFVTTKHWITERGYQKTIAACEGSLKKLGLDYIDLYLIHWPAVARCDPKWEETNLDTWRGFERLYKDGKVRAIGVSNFLPVQLDSLIRNCEIGPMVNQIEFHPGCLQRETVSYSRYKGMIVEAWSPLGSGAVLKDAFLAKIAAGYGKTVAQLCIRFALQNGVIPLPKSSSPARIQSNTDVFDFEISPEDMRAIADMPITGYSGFYPEDAPAESYY